MGDFIYYFVITSCSILVPILIQYYTIELNSFSVKIFKFEKTWPRFILNNNITISLLCILKTKEI